MSALAAAARGLLSLFVDDGRDTLAILLWLGLVWQGVGRLGLPPPVAPLLLFAGLALVLLSSAVRRARKGRSG
jgi:hypothetical protein